MSRQAAEAIISFPEQDLCKLSNYTVDVLLRPVVIWQPQQKQPTLMVEHSSTPVASFVMLAEGDRDIPQNTRAFRNKGATIIRVIEANQSLPQMRGLNIKESSRTLKS